MENAQQRWARLHPERVKEIKAKYRKSPPDKSKDGHLQRNYGMSLQQRENAMRSQFYRCAICNTPFVFTQPCVDHDHVCCPGKKSCGKCLRQILCWRCNIVLGHVDDDIQLLTRMIGYLDKWRRHGIQTDSGGDHTASLGG